MQTLKKYMEHNKVPNLMKIVLVADKNEIRYLKQPFYKNRKQIPETEYEKPHGFVVSLFPNGTSIGSYLLEELYVF